MIVTDREVVLSPSEADYLLGWPLTVLAPFIADGRVWHEGRRVRVVDRFGNELGATK